MPVVINIEANLEWKFTQDKHSGLWIAVCDAMQIVIEGESFPDLCESMNEALDLMFRDMLSNGSLQNFLTERGWKSSAIPIRVPERVAFNIPFDTRRVEHRDLLGIAA